MTLREGYMLLGGSLEETLSRLGDRSLLMKHLKQFPADDALPVLQRAVAAGDRTGTWQAAHSLRGICRTLGLERLAQAAEQVMAADGSAMSMALTMLEQEHAHAVAIIGLLEESDTALTMLVHELRTPLQAILGTAETHPDMEGMARVALAGRHMAAVLAGQLPRREAFSLAVMLENAVELLRGAMGSDCPRVKTEIALGHERVLGDAPRVTQVLLNLLTNAARSSTKNDTIILWATEADGEVALAVEDHGPGMSDRERVLAFEPHWRGRTDPGMGLGLPIARALTEEMGGTITLTHTPGGGATATVRLPMPGIVEEEVRIVEKERKFNGLRALLAEDDRLSAEVSAELLKGLGLGIRVARSGREAAWLARESTFDCVFLDAHMPVSGGEATVRAIREALPDAPIFVITGGVGPEEEERLREAGMQACLIKPVSAEQLARILSTCFPDQ